MRPSASLSLRRYGAARGSHRHDHFQVLVGLDGELALEVEGRAHRIGAGQGWVVGPGERHDFEASGGSRCLVLDTADAAWAERGPAPRQVAQTLALGRFLAQALQLRHALATAVGPQLLLEAWDGAQAPSTARPRRAIDWAALAAWLRARWQQPLEVADLAAHCGLGVSQFAQRCRAELGMGAMQWLRLQRLQQARCWRAAGMPVAEVARRCGYRSPSALTAALRRSGGP